MKLPKVFKPTKEKSCLVKFGFSMNYSQVTHPYLDTLTLNIFLRGKGGYNNCPFNPGRRKNWAVYYTSLQSFFFTNAFLFSSLTTLGTFWNFNWVVHKVSTTNCKNLCITIRNLHCTYIYWPLS